MRTTITGLMATAALLALGACSKTPKPADLPPPPPTQSAPTGSGAVAPPAAPSTNVSGPRPGSRADLIASAGSDTVNFATDSSDVDDTAKAILTQQAAWLQRNPNVRVTVEGHCDERGTREYNLALGERRASSAKNFLVAAGVAASRITVISYGKEHPLAEGSDESAWAQNRRAVSVVPE
jgi:peptidoglycan-associated lipoprotein